MLSVTRGSLEASGSPSLAAQERLRTGNNRDLGLVEHCKKNLRQLIPQHLRRIFYVRQRQAEAHPEDVPFGHPFYWAGFVMSGAEFPSNTAP
jgi:CHAT domain-containing protein